MTHYPLIVAPQRVPEIYYGGSSHSTSNTSSFSFTSMDFNVDNPTRLIVVALNYYEYDTSVDLNAITVGGVGPTLVTNTLREVSGGTGSYIYTRLYSVQPTGTSGTISLTFNRTIDYGCSVAVWSLYNLNSTTAVSTANNSVIGTSTSIGLTVQPGDLAIATATSVYNPTGATWTNATENYDSAPNPMIRTGASATASTSGTLTITAAVNNTPGGVVLSGAAWR